MERRVLIAVALSILIVLLYPILLGKLYPEQAKSRYLRQNDTVHDTVRDINDTVQFDGREEPDKQRLQNAQLPVADDSYTKNDTVHDTVYDTDLYRIVLSARGACIKEIYLKEYAQSQEELLKLAAIESSQDGIFSISGLDPMTRFDRVIYESIAGEQGITFRYSEPGRFEVAKRYNFHKEQYFIEFEIEIRNLSNQIRDVQYNIVAAAGIDCRSPLDGRFMEISTLAGNQIVRDNLRKVKRGEIRHYGTVSWTCLRNRYFSLILKPFAPSAGSFSRALDQRGLLTGVETSVLALQPNSSTTQRFLLYAGPNKLKQLSSLNLGFEDAVGFGIFSGISRLLLSTLNFFYGVVKNYGVSIMLLTLMVSIILFPLTWRSLKSTREMQAIQPLIAKLRGEYKDNPQKLNKEMIALYREHKVNPLGGCLPMFLQMPIFIALYQTLMRSVELWGAGFLWIKDLTRPDAAKLPFTLPVIGNSINILPILMIVAMMLQQKISQPKTNAQTEQQKQMMLFMPLIFGFIFYSLPSGLVLYWLTNTFLMTSHQWLITHRQNKN